MTLISPPLPERILAYGPPGSGKSELYFDIANNTSGRLFAVDLDNAIPRMLQGHPDLDQDRFVFRKALEWGEIIAGLKAFMAQAVPGDWIILDMLSGCYRLCQHYVLDKKFNVQPEWGETVEWTKEMQKEMPGYWNTVKDVFGGFLGAIMARSDAHIFACSEERAIRDDSGFIKEKREVRSLFGDEGFTPVGSALDGHIFHTVFHTTRLAGRTPKHFITTVKERGGREKLYRADVTDASFSAYYLEDIAGWQRDAAASPRRRRTPSPASSPSDSTPPRRRRRNPATSGSRPT